MKSLTLTNYLGVFLVGAAVAACTTKANTNESTPMAASRLPVDVRVVRATPLVQEETVVGSVLANREVVIMSEVSKKIVAISFKDGGHVSAGQLLYKLDDAEVMARLKQAQAEFSLAKLTENRLAELLKSEAVRQEEYDVAFTRLQSLQATVDLFNAELSKTSIHAPFAGTVGITKAQVGALASMGLPLVTLQESGNVKIQFSVPEKYAAIVKQGKQISFKTSFAETVFKAKISAIEPGIDLLNRNILVHAIALNPNGVLKAGMSVRVSYAVTDEDAKGISLPTEALIPGSNGYSVFVVRNGAASMTPVTLGNRNDREALISSGLHDGDTVMVSNILRSGNGTPVQAVSYK